MHSYYGHACAITSERVGLLQRRSACALAGRPASGAEVKKMMKCKQQRQQESANSIARTRQRHARNCKGAAATRRQPLVRVTLLYCSKVKRPQPPHCQRAASGNRNSKWLFALSLRSLVCPDYRTAGLCALARQPARRTPLGARRKVSKVRTLASAPPEQRLSGQSIRQEAR